VLDPLLRWYEAMVRPLPWILKRLSGYALALAPVLAGTALGGCATKETMHPPREPILSTHAEPGRSDPEEPRAVPPPSKPGQVGLASWYGAELAGRRTTSGERFDPKLYTGAHRRLPFGTWVEVRRVDTGRTVRVRINDRGPNGKAKSRVIDLSRRAADDLDLVRDGVVRVELRVVHGP
jgi:rare lipoprotein A